MSGFEDNPFGEPIIDNPFADPAIQNVTRTTANNILQTGLEDYNPFEDETTQPSSTFNPTTTQAVPAYAPSGQQYNTNIGSNPVTQISTAELLRRQEELEKKAAELERREAELLHGTSTNRFNNWPPIPSFCPFQPCFYHDISLDIPSEFQKIVQNLYYLWMCYTLIMCVNIIGGLALWIHSSDFKTFGLAIFYCILFTPASFLCWYRPAYKAFRSDSSFNFMMFFFIFFFQTLVTVIQAVGIPGTGTCGIILAIGEFQGTLGSVLVGIFLLLIAFGYGVCAAGNFIMLTKIHGIYRSGTDSNRISMTKAREEFQTGFFGNQHVRNAAAGATRASFSSAFRSA